MQVLLWGCGSDLVAQLVEQRPFKAWVVGSSPTGITACEANGGSLAQLVQSISFTPRGSLVRVQQELHEKIIDIIFGVITIYGYT